MKILSKKNKVYKIIYRVKGSREKTLSKFNVLQNDTQI
jgi:hypothetical protein